jgi:hypothetical protein
MSDGRKKKKKYLCLLGFWGKKVKAHLPVTFHPYYLNEQNF